MHELSIAMSILDVAEEALQDHAGARVEAIYIRVGPLAGVVREALESAFELAREQTQFAQTRLLFEDAPIVIFCERCQAERGVESVQRLCCTECGAPANEIRRGRDLELAALELEEPAGLEASAELHE